MNTKTTGRKLLLLTAALALTLSAAAVSQPPAGGGVRSAAYGWPVKPFDRPHPVRGSFGDPRTIFNGEPTQQTLLTGSGSFSFHFGIDVSAPDGTAVYPVVSGTVSTITREWVGVQCGSRSFQYWHITATVHLGQWVTARQTVLGHILRGCAHVHLAELNGDVIVNPLAPGHLQPYNDTTRPVVRAITIRSATGETLLPELVRGRVDLIVDAYDTPALPVPAEWHGLPVAPALVEWSIVRTGNGKIVVPTRVAFDVRSQLPADSDFWLIYARGTHQNMSVFGKHYSYMQPGVYLFRLAQGGLDTTHLRDDVYDLKVKATDIRGNSGQLTLRFSVHNQPGVVGV
jgi:hypothetical protein